MYYCGIDPGSDGGVAILDEKGNAKEYIIYDDVNLSNLLAKYIGEETKICIEDVHAILYSSARATFKFGFNTGKAHGIVTNFLTWTRQPLENFTKVLPGIWKKDMGALLGDNASYEERKQKSIERFHEVFPDISIKCKKQYKKDSNGKFIMEEKQVSKNKTKMARVWEYTDHDGIADAFLIAEWLRQKCV